MAAILLLLILLMVGLAFLPQFWVRRVIKQHAHERADFSGTGGQFARHLLDRMNLRHVAVEESMIGDHYDPDAKAVRLVRDNMHRRSLSAIVIAAHEVGHAMQDASGYKPLIRRTALARQAEYYQSVGAMVMLATPLAFIFFKSPALIAVELMAGLAIMSMTIVLHAFTLPVEFDASFGRALPLLREGRFLRDEDLPAARSILRAAAFTYVAAAALSLLDVMRWLRVLRG